MKKYKIYFMSAGIALLGFFLCYLSAAAWGSIAWGRGNALFYLESPLSVEGALSVAAQNQEIASRVNQGQEVQEGPFQFCLWGQEEDAVASNENLSRSLQASLIFFCGSPELLFEGCRVPLMEDSQGCLIDEKAAWELFGSLQAVGKEVTFGNNKYLVRNVVPGQEGVLALPVSRIFQAKDAGQDDAGMDMDAIINRVTLKKPAGQSIRELEAAWANSCQMPVEVLDLELLRGFGGFCALLAPLALCVFFCAYLFCLYRGQDAVAGKAAMVGAFLALAVLLLAFLKDKVKIPDEYIPTRWSEFSFWESLWERKVDAVELLLRIPKSNLDNGWMDCFFHTCAYGVLAAVCLVAAVVLAGSQRTREDKKKSRDGA